MQLVANTNFNTNDYDDYSTSSNNIPILFNEHSTAEGIKTYSINVNRFINMCDATKLKYIKVEYTGQPSARELREMFVDWFIVSNMCTVTYNKMELFHSLKDHMKIYSNVDGNGGIVIYNLYPDVVCPNGFYRWMFDHPNITRNVFIHFDFKEIPAVTIENITLTTMRKFITGQFRSEQAILARDTDTYPKWQYFSANAINVSLPEPITTTNHMLYATGNVHGMFVKTELNDMVSLKIKLNGNTVFLNYTNAIDIQMNSIQFDNSDWVFIPFDLERKYNTVADCFVADHNGGLELGRIDMFQVTICHATSISQISYGFPAYMSLHQRGIPISELRCGTVSIETGNPFLTSFLNPIYRSPLHTILSTAEPIPGETLDDCVISHEPINSGDTYVVCMTCLKSMLLLCATTWLQSEHAADSCPHCRCVWREFNTNIKVYKQT